MARLRRSDCSHPGITRRRRGKGFSYTDEAGHPVTDPAVLDRIRALAIPPAWTDVWICPWPNGHIQALGTDAAGRRQYRYHDGWRVRRDQEKFARVEEFGRTLPRLRKMVERDLAGAGLSRERVLAAIVRLLDVGFFRVGGADYAAEHETFGVATLRKEHVSLRGDGWMCFEYPAKGSIERKAEIYDPAAGEIIAALRRRRSGENLFAYKDGRRWVDVAAQDVNDYIKSAAGREFSSKDFRTWSASVLAATELAGTNDRPPKAAVRSAVRTVSEWLGNTPTVCRSSYIDPRVIDRFENGETISDRLSSRRSIEDAVIELLDGSGDGRGAA
jgi:DNA topoisomerase IB